MEAALAAVKGTAAAAAAARQETLNDF